MSDKSIDDDVVAILLAGRFGEFISEEFRRPDHDALRKRGQRLVAEQQRTRSANPLGLPMMGY